MSLDTLVGWGNSQEYRNVDAMVKGLYRDKILHAIGQYNDQQHPVTYYTICTTIDLENDKHRIAEEVNRLACQFITVEVKPDRQGSAPSKIFAIGPTLFEPQTVAYHATPTHLVGKIMAEGLLPGDKSRCQSNFPDTQGRIFASGTLVDEPGRGDPAIWWQQHLARRTCKPYSIIRINLADLLGARVYRDPLSQWGYIIDCVDRIQPNRLRVIESEELIPTAL